MDPARPAGAAGGSSTVEALYTLSEVAEATGISLAELDGYRRRHGNRVPSIVLGETRRYPQEALEAFRALHRAREAAGNPSHGGRRLMSLTAQRRGREPEPRERERPSNGGSENRVTAEVPAEAPDGVTGNVLGGPEPGNASIRLAPSEPERDHPRSETGTDQTATAPREGRGTFPEARGEQRPATDGALRVSDSRLFPTPARTPLPPTATVGSGTWELPAQPREPAEDEEAVEVVTRSGAGPVPPPSRPARPLYTLQQVHEHTGIPYPTLAFYAAADADAVPAVGERYSRLYPWEAMAAFSRLHAAKTPGWTAPDLAPPESVAAWRRDDGIAGRLEQLQRSQDQLADELDTILRDLAGPLTGFARYAEQVPG